jgi:hypothetical protein
MYFDENGVKDKLILSPQPEKEKKHMSKTPTGVGEINLKELNLKTLNVSLLRIKLT